MKKMIGLNIVILYFTIILSIYNETTAQPPYDITKVDYVNFLPHEIPQTETLWTYDVLGGVFYDDYIIKTFETYCNTVFENMENCNNWSGWMEGVYNVKHSVSGCEIRVEYRWRFCLSNHNLTQQQIISIFF